MAFDNHAGANKLARTLSNRMKNESKSSLVLDFGSINSDYSLTTNTFPVKIPKKRLHSLQTYKRNVPWYFWRISWRT